MLKIFCRIYIFFAKSGHFHTCFFHLSFLLILLNLSFLLLSKKNTYLYLELALPCKGAASYRQKKMVEGNFKDLKISRCNFPNLLIFFFENSMLSRILFVRNWNVVTQAMHFTHQIIYAAWRGKISTFLFTTWKNKDRITSSGHRRFAFRKCPHLWHARLHKQIKRKQDGFCFLWKQ